MATKLQQIQQPALDTYGETKLDSFAMGVGIFNTTPDFDRDVATAVPISFRGHDWSEVSAERLGNDIRNGQSFTIIYKPDDLKQVSAARNLPLSAPLRQGYKKHFVLDISERQFEQMMWGLVDVYGFRRGLPLGKLRGFLGAIWRKDVSTSALLDAATRQCIHRCNPPKQCRQIGCTCNPTLHRCV